MPGCTEKPPPLFQDTIQFQAFRVWQKNISQVPRTEPRLLLESYWKPPGRLELQDRTNSLPIHHVFIKIKTKSPTELIFLIVAGRTLNSSTLQCWRHMTGTGMQNIKCPSIILEGLLRSTQSSLAKGSYEYITNVELQMLGPFHSSREEVSDGRKWNWFSTVRYCFK